LLRASWTIEMTIEMVGRDRASRYYSRRIALISSENCCATSLTSARRLVTASRNACTGVVLAFVCTLSTIL